MAARVPSLLLFVYVVYAVSAKRVGGEGGRSEGQGQGQGLGLGGKGAATEARARGQR